jgi:predicted phage tail component-like protein
MSDWGGFRLIVDSVSYQALDLGIFMREGASDPILPDIRERMIEVSGKNGAYYFGADLGARRITIPCAFVDAGTESELNARVESLVALLVDSNNKPRRIELIFESNPDSGYYVYVSGSLPLTRRVFVGEFDLMFVAPDPIQHIVSAYT